MERFWSKVEKSDGCWLWKGSLRPDGYGQFRFEGTTRRAHRVAWILSHDETPTGLILHRCDVRSCVNPAHLYEGDHSQNAHDRVERNGWRGQNHGKENCKHGHPLDGENLYVTPDGRRQCKECRRVSDRKWRNHAG